MLFNFSVWPITAGDRTAEAVASVVDIIDRSGLPYQLTAMATLIEGEWHEVLPLVTECELRTRERYGRTYCVLTVDSDARGAGGELSHDVREVERILGRPLRT